MGSYIDNVRCGNCDAGLMLEASIVTIQNYREQPTVRHFWVYCSFCATHKLYWPTVRQIVLADVLDCKTVTAEVLPDEILASYRKDSSRPTDRARRRSSRPPRSRSCSTCWRRRRASTPPPHGRSATCHPTGRIDRHPAGRDMAAPPGRRRLVPRGAVGPARGLRRRRDRDCRRRVRRRGRLLRPFPEDQRLGERAVAGAGRRAHPVGSAGDSAETSPRRSGRARRPTPACRPSPGSWTSNPTAADVRRRGKARPADPCYAGRRGNRLSHVTV